MLIRHVAQQNDFDYMIKQYSENIPVVVSEE